VPCTVAVHCDVPLGLTVEGVQLTETDVMVGGTACTVTVVVPNLVASWLLVAVTVTGPAAAGAVKRPLLVIDPELADHATEELKLPVP